MINKVFLCGNVGQDPRITTFDNGGKVAQFSLATTEKGFKTQDGKDIPDRTYWHNIVVNRKGLNTLVEKYIRKGDKLALIGELRYRTWQDKNGDDRTIAEVYVEELEICTHHEKEKAPAPEPEFNPGAPVEKASPDDYDKFLAGLE